jgi:hypothetical protein
VGIHRCGRIKWCNRPYDPPPLELDAPDLAPEAVEGRFLASVLDGMAIGRCGRPTSKPWDEPPSLGDIQGALGMTVVAVDRPERWTH